MRQNLPNGRTGFGDVPFSMPVASSPFAGVTFSDKTPVRDLLPPAPTSLLGRPRHLLPLLLRHLSLCLLRLPLLLRPLPPKR